ncbi:ABC transporter ATP-binding protein [Niveispirillum sp. KHB5.9]|uniref:ABC transporter ATP-binding protein n=1 Tax=Niveispirillum sp. KHB5.9 TaxID=3400269 RepID=UPI003A8459E2
MPVHIRLEDVDVRFQIFGLHGRSLKKTALNLSTGGRIGAEPGARVHIDALCGVNLELGEGDRVGLIGHNGAGKSTLLRTMAGIYEPTAGRVSVQGRVSPMFDLMLGIDPDATGRENVRLRGLLLGMTAKEIDAYAGDICDFSGLGDYLDLPVKVYSSGMLLRLMFAVATAISPEILLLDEWITAGDAAFMERAENRVNALIDRASMLVIASHSRPLVERLCNKVMVLEHGRVVDFGPLTPALLDRALAA